MHAARLAFVSLALTALGSAAVEPVRLDANSSEARQAPAVDLRAFVSTYCTSCHNDRLRTGGLSLADPELDRSAGASGAVGESAAQGQYRPDAAGETAASRSRRPSPRRHAHRHHARSRRRGAARSGPGRRASSESDRVRQCRPRSARREHRHGRTAAARRGRRWLRQCGGEPRAVAGASRTLSDRGA